MTPLQHAPATDPAESRLAALVVEDDDATRLLLTQMLRSRGHDVVDVADVGPAWDAFTTQPFRLILLDLVLPGGDGLELCRRMRQHPRGLRLKFRATADGIELHAPFTPEREHEGFTRVVHGGIISSLLDEAMAWAIYARNRWAVTGRMSVSFRRPVEVGVPTVVVGRVVSDRGRLIDAEGEVRRAADGEVLASATATFVRVPEEQAAAWRQGLAEWGQTPQRIERPHPRPEANLQQVIRHL